MRKSLLTVVCGLSLLGTAAQDIATDSKGKGVFPFLSERKSRLELDPKSFSFNLQGKVSRWLYGRVLDKSDTNERLDTNVTKASFQFYQFSALNIADLITYSSVGTIRPGFRARAGYQRIVKEIKPGYPGWAYTLGGSINAGFDNLKVYDLELPDGKKEYPLIGGADMSLTLFPPWHKRSLIVLTGTYAYGYNDTELLNFKELSGAGITTVGAAFDKFDGKYGILRDGVNSGRASLSFPTILCGRFAPVPYAAVVVRDASVPTWFVGGFLNLFAERVSFSKLSASNTFGVGVDWSKGEGTWDPPTWFVRGSIAFGKA